MYLDVTWLSWKTTSSHRNIPNPQKINLQSGTTHPLKVGRGNPQFFVWKKKHFFCWGGCGSSLRYAPSIKTTPVVLIQSLKFSFILKETTLHSLKLAASLPWKLGPTWPQKEAGPSSNHQCSGAFAMENIYQIPGDLSVEDSHLQVLIS